MIRGRPGTALVVICVSAFALLFAVPAAFAGRAVPAQSAGACADPDVAAPTDPANPLALPVTPSNGDPLQGAHFFVDGPKHGQAAGAVAQLLGLNPTGFADADSWAGFQVAHAAAIAANPEAQELSKIANQGETQNISLYAQGGGPGAIAAQTTKILCTNMSADPTPATVPVLSTFFIYPHGQYCPQLPAIQRWWPTFKRLVNEMAGAVGRKRAVILMEIDSLGTSSCLDGKSLKLWLKELHYEAQQFSKLPHAVTYEEAGASDESNPARTAARLKRAGIELVRGFYTNDTHFAWSSSEIRWAQAISAKTGGSHFVVNTAQNGQGPQLNPHPAQQGIEDLATRRAAASGGCPPGT